jgi:DNA-binding beta-propeller fold protein YncE
LVSLSGKIPLATTQGRIDHMAVDLQRRLLFVAALGNNSVGIADIGSGELTKSIAGLSAPQGVIFAPDNGKLYVSSAGDGTLSVFDSRNLTLLEKISFPGGDADNMRLDALNKSLYVGYGSGGIAKVDTSTDKIVKEFPLPGHPEAFEIQSSAQLIFVNIPTANIIETINSSTGISVSNYTLNANSANFPMALDQADGRLFVATRSPPELMVLDTSTQSLKSVANVTIAGDPDDIFYDSARGLVYVSCGQGSLEVIQQSDPDHYGLAQTITTAPGARTSLFVPELASIFVAAPTTVGQQAEILVVSLGAASSTSSSSSGSTSPTPTSASLAVTPAVGPSGLVVTVSGGGYVPGVRYQVCLGFANSACGYEYHSGSYPASIGKFATLGSFIADSGGSIPSGTTVTIPDLFGGNYSVGVVPYDQETFFVSAHFTVETPALFLSASAVAAGSSVTLMGSGYAPATTYRVCVVPSGTVDCAYSGDREEEPPGYLVGNFTTDAGGNIPLGTTVTTPLQPPIQAAIGVFLPSVGNILISETEFTVTASG